MEIEMYRVTLVHMENSRERFSDSGTCIAE